MGALTGPARRDGWEGALADMVDAARARPFAWGRHDCLTWAADCVAAMTGVGTDEPWRGSYRTARGAIRVLRRMGHRTVADAVTSRLGAPLASPLMAQRGDILSDGEAMGVCVGADGAFPGPSGLVFRPVLACMTAWRV